MDDEANPEGEALAPGDMIEPAVAIPAWRGPGIVCRGSLGCTGSTSGPAWVTSLTALGVTGREDWLPAGRLQKPVLGYHHEAIAQVGAATGEAVDGQFLRQRETCRGVGLEPLRGRLQGLQAEAHHRLELNPLAVGVLPGGGSQLRKGDEAPGQIIAVDGTGIEAKERLRPFAEVLQAPPMFGRVGHKLAAQFRLPNDHLRRAPIGQSPLGPIHRVLIIDVNGSRDQG
jgi:hypothetical protein